jgi:protein TonB
MQQSTKHRYLSYRKSASSDENRWGGLLLNGGFLITLAFLFLAFNWQDCQRSPITLNSEKVSQPQPIEMNSPNTQHKVKSMTKVTQPSVTKNQKENEEKPNKKNNKLGFKNTSMNTNFVPGEKVKEEESPFIIVEKMPAFPGGEKAMLRYIQSNVNHPEEAKKKGIEGTVVARFVVSKDGRIRDIEILKNPGGGCGEEVVRLLKNMPRWEPGKQRGRKVTVYYKLPVKFELR